MSNDLTVLYVTAASMGFVHTLFGPDHYLPFIVMGKARGWSYFRTFLITLACGIGHILSSVLLGALGIIFGIAVMKLEMFESFRGNIAAWLLIGFGFAYFLWGVRQAVRNRPHSHVHAHDGDVHIHGHGHSDEHAHVHGNGKKNITPWVLFTIFVFGPCEPLIPILMYPAAKNSVAGVWLVTAIFGSVTIATMLTIVMLAYFGINLIPMHRVERYTHAIAGAAIFLCGIAIQFLGL